MSNVTQVIACQTPSMAVMETVTKTLVEVTSHLVVVKTRVEQRVAEIEEEASIVVGKEVGQLVKAREGQGWSGWSGCRRRKKQRRTRQSTWQRKQMEMYKNTSEWDTVDITVEP